MVRKLFAWAMTVALMLSLCACGGTGGAARKLQGTYERKGEGCLLFDRDGTYELYIESYGGEYTLAFSGTYTTDGENLRLYYEGESQESGFALEYKYVLDGSKLSIKRDGSSVAEVYEKVSSKCIRPAASETDRDSEEGQVSGNGKTGKLQGTYERKGEGCLLFDWDGTYEVYIESYDGEYTLAFSGTYTTDGENLRLYYDGESWASGIALEYKYAIDGNKLSVKRDGSSVAEVYEKVSNECIRPATSDAEHNTDSSPGNDLLTGNDTSPTKSLSPLRENLDIPTETDDYIYTGYMEHPTAFIAPEELTQEIANDVYAAFDCFLEDCVFPSDDTWYQESQYKWWVTPVAFGEYTVTVSIRLPNEQYGTLRYEFSGAVTVLDDQGSYAVSNFLIDVSD